MRAIVGAIIETAGMIGIVSWVDLPELLGVVLTIIGWLLIASNIRRGPAV